MSATAYGLITQLRDTVHGWPASGSSILMEDESK